ncbi:unnamed protein product (macronuclear) [Paramecium tetraurelia]|uniref:Uncharacterized protein n=1 Tax=Paramecium tetraurelia TaxID=5888 RepID=A0E7C9_PARTE|nr:uncharacterized protein GSPATT00023924001 [Paramecium tetraurelia]CAK91196.1 unnamed protein product [Paramecium tetraurelia]|eukprot:XP_001458593.1 hypothetical protein (macronuclear) [Paramecium tetraurelia strain d4-2]
MVTKNAKKPRNAERIDLQQIDIEDDEANVYKFSHKHFYSSFGEKITYWYWVQKRAHFKNDIWKNQREFDKQLQNHQPHFKLDEIIKTRDKIDAQQIHQLNIQRPLLEWKQRSPKENVGKFKLLKKIAKYSMNLNSTYIRLKLLDKEVIKAILEQYLSKSNYSTQYVYQLNKFQLRGFWNRLQQIELIY